MSLPRPQALLCMDATFLPTNKALLKGPAVDPRGIKFARDEPGPGKSSVGWSVVAHGSKMAERVCIVY